MTRSEARTALAAGLALLVAGLVWLVGPWGLVGPGIVLLVIALFVAEVKETDSAEALESARWEELKRRSSGT